MNWALSQWIEVNFKLGDDRYVWLTFKNTSITPQNNYMKRAKVYMHDSLAGILTEDENGFHFSYIESYLNSAKAEPVSLTLPLSHKTYKSRILFPFFDGLIPEGWLLDIAQKNWKLDPRDRMEILLKTGRDCIGAVSIEEE